MVGLRVKSSSVFGLDGCNVRRHAIQIFFLSLGFFFLNWDIHVCWLSQISQKRLTFLASCFRHKLIKLKCFVLDFGELLFTSSKNSKASPAGVDTITLFNYSTSVWENTCFCLALNLKGWSLATLMYKPITFVCMTPFNSIFIHLLYEEKETLQCLKKFLRVDWVQQHANIFTQTTHWAILLLTHCCKQYSLFNYFINVDSQ